MDNCTGVFKQDCPWTCIYIQGCINKSIIEYKKLLEEGFVNKIDLDNILHSFIECQVSLKYSLLPKDRFISITFNKFPNDSGDKLKAFNEIASYLKNLKLYDSTYMYKCYSNHRAYMVTILIDSKNTDFQIVAESGCDFMTIRSTYISVIEEMISIMKRNIKE